MIPVVTNTIYTLSFWVLPGAPTTNNLNLTVRLYNSSLLASVSLQGTSTSTRYTPGTNNSSRATLPAFPLVWLNEIQPTNTSGGVVDRLGERDRGWNSTTPARATSIWAGFT